MTPSGRRDQAVREHDAAVEGEAGLLARIDALDRVTARSSALHRAHLVLFLFLTALECLPVLVKLLLTFARPTRYEQIARLRDDHGVRSEELRLQTEFHALELEQAAVLDAATGRARTDVAAATEVAVDAQRHRVELGKARNLEWRRQQDAQIADDVRRLLDDQLRAPAA